MIEQTFDTYNSILRVTYSGEISMEEINSFGTYIQKANDLPKKLKILADARNAIYTFSEKDIDNIMSVFLRYVAGYTLIAMAMIYNRPVETAYSLLLQTRNKQGTYKHAIFINEKNALEWLSNW